MDLPWLSVVLAWFKMLPAVGGLEADARVAGACVVVRVSPVRVGTGGRYDGEDTLQGQDELQITVHEQGLTRVEQLISSRQ